jgi:ubiquitin-protein ligase
MSQKECATISSLSVRRLLGDVKTIMQNPLTDHGIYYSHDEADMLKGYALIIGQEDTPYFGGFYFFEFAFPPNYPYSPPTVTFCTNNGQVRFNPNLYTNGKVCVSILNTWKGDQWSSCQTITTVLLSLAMLFSKMPLLNEPGVGVKHPDMKNYNSIIEWANISVAICDVIKKHPRVYLEGFYQFYDIVLDHFLLHFDKHHEFVYKKYLQHIEPIGYDTNMYNIHVIADYGKLLDRLMECKAIAMSLREPKTNTLEPSIKEGCEAKTPCSESSV